MGQNRQKRYASAAHSNNNTSLERLPGLSAGFEFAPVEKFPLHPSP